MPVYAYQCANCGVQFERQQKFTDPPVKKCPECRKNRVQKVILPSRIVFKGSGWYATDSRSPSGASSSKKKDKDSEGKSETTATESSESKSTSKPKPEPKTEPSH